MPYAFLRALNVASAGARDTLPKVLAALIARLEWDWYAVWLLPPGGGALSCVDSGVRSGGHPAEAPMRGDRCQIGADVAGAAWASGLQLTAGAVPATSRIGVAVRLRGRPVAVFEFGLPTDPTHVPAELTDVLMEAGSNAFVYLYLTHRHTLEPAPLTAREQQVLQWGAEGLSAAGIASILEISEATVKTHFEHLYAKLGVSDRAGAVAQGFRRGLLR